MDQSRPVFDSRGFRDAVGCFATGVCIVTGRAGDGTPIGVTVNSFSSVSLEPPLVLFSLARNNNSFEDFLNASHYVVNVLTETQIALSRSFALPNDSKFDGLDYDTWETGCPVLPGSLAVLECDAHDTHEGGDHVIFVGRVRRLVTVAEGVPLLYYRGRYSRLDPP